MTRTFYVHGHKLKNMPTYAREETMEKLHNLYKRNPSVKEAGKPIGYNDFATVLRVLTTEARLNAGLSYYYVDHLDLVEITNEMFDRITEIFDEAYYLGLFTSEAASAATAASVASAATAASAASAASDRRKGTELQEIATKAHDRELLLHLFPLLMRQSVLLRLAPPILPTTGPRKRHGSIARWFRLF